MSMHIGGETPPTPANEERSLVRLKHASPYDGDFIHAGDDRKSQPAGQLAITHGEPAAELPEADVFNLYNQDMHPDVVRACNIYDQVTLSLAQYMGRNEPSTRELPQGAFEAQLPAVKVKDQAAFRLTVSRSNVGNTQFILDGVGGDGVPRNKSGFILVRDEYGNVNLLPNDKSKEAALGSDEYGEQLNAAEALFKCYFQKLAAASRLGVNSVGAQLQQLRPELTVEQRCARRAENIKKYGRLAYWLRWYPFQFKVDWDGENGRGQESGSVDSASEPDHFYWYGIPIRMGEKGRGLTG